MSGRVIAFLSRFVGRQAETSTSGRSTITSFPSLVTDGELTAHIDAIECSRYLRQYVCAAQSRSLALPERRRSPNLQRFHLMVCSPADTQATEAGSLRLQMVVDGTVGSGMRQPTLVVCRTAQ